MKRIYAVTGGCGHLGNTLIKKLTSLGNRVRALALPGESLAALAECPGVELYRGDVREQETLEAFFEHREQEELCVIHTAALISIESKASPQLRAVNVEGVKNMVAQCLRHPNTRLVHVSSVHALPEQPGRGIIHESEQFCPQWVKGAYAKTKAEAAQYVLDAVAYRGLNATLVMPAGILGPGDYGANHLNCTIRACVTGTLHTLVRGGYNLVDVRDVADACIAAVDKGIKGECYTLAGRHYEWREVVEILRAQDSNIKVHRFLSPSALRPVAPFLELHAKVWDKPPLFTGYSMYCMTSNDNFSSRKARETFHFCPRPIQETLWDTAAWELDRYAAQVQAKQQQAKFVPIRRHKRLKSTAIG